jgi:hypothetical protein
MAGFNSVRSLIDAEVDEGNFKISSFRKAPVQVTTQGLWFDLSMSPGNPPPQYYAASPLNAIQMKYSTDGGLFHGPAITSGTKHLRELCLTSTSATGLPAPFILCDYLMFYPFIDEGTTDPQTLTNSVTLPRYTDGKGVQVMAVSVAGRTGGQTFRFTYTNSDGVAGRVSQTVIQNSATAIGTIVSSANATNLSSGPFVGLQSGDQGVRSIESVQMISGSDVGLFTLVLVKPIETYQLYEQTAPAEKDSFRDQFEAPIIYDDAYLNFLCMPNGSLSGVAFNGYLKTVWK